MINKHCQPARRHTAFTLMELLITIGIIALVAALSFPTIKAMLKVSHIRAGIDSIQIATTAARAFATRDLNAKFQNIGVNATGGPFNGSYSGVAMLFTPGNEIRLVENVPYANSGDTNDVSGYLESPNYTSTYTPAGHPQINISSSCNGYADIPDIAYIKIPPRAGVLALTWRSHLDFLSPPFAIRFDEKGHLIAGEGGAQLIVYDKDYNATWVAADQIGNYNPDEWDPHSTLFNPSNWDSNVNKVKLPFEGITTAIGLLVYDRELFESEFGDITKTGEYLTDPNLSGYNLEILQWFEKNGVALLFNRYSGAIMKYEGAVK